MLTPGIPSPSFQLPTAPKLPSSELRVVDWEEVAKRYLLAAESLIQAEPGHPDQALYMAGFALELALKRTIKKRDIPIQQHMGTMTHNLLHLLFFSQLYMEARQTVMLSGAIQNVGFLTGATPPGFTYWELFTHIYSKWYNEFRYSTGNTTYAEATDFVQAVKEMMAWILQA
jgi:hypothetical protein